MSVRGARLPPRRKPREADEEVKHGLITGLKQWIKDNMPDDHWAYDNDKFEVEKFRSFEEKWKRLFLYEGIYLSAEDIEYVNEQHMKYEKLHELFKMCSAYLKYSHQA
mmetsp:Transcript_22576/g.76780  ORF Transcript_22576/g.76780 Transcript_22576/m.76780 type:complete len:108 (-) Transcript_22576:484-807(-)